MLFCIMRAKFSLMGDSHECSFSRELMIVELPQIIVDALWSTAACLSYFFCVEVLTPQGASVKALWALITLAHFIFSVTKREDLMTDASIRPSSRFNACLAALKCHSKQYYRRDRDMFIISSYVQIPICTNKLPIFRWPCIVVLYILKVASWRASVDVWWYMCCR